MFREILRDIKEYILGVVKSREFVMVIVFLALAALLIQRLFVLQIVNGEDYLNTFTLKIKKERVLNGTRGNIYDSKGNLLAYNELAYSVTIEDNGEYDSISKKNKELNSIIDQVIQIVEGNGDTMISDFQIVLDSNDNYIFSVEGTSLMRFRADVYGKKTIDELEPAQKNASADTIMARLCADNKTGYGISPDFSKEEILKIASVRFAMAGNNYQKYMATTIATDVSDETVAVIMENSDKLQGVQIEKGFLRRYNDSLYFSHIIGYTGKASQEELDELKKQDDSYALNDIIGKSGIEQYMETDLQGKKGMEKFYVDNLGKVLEVSERTEPEAGNDLYLTIDRDLQIAVYDIIEQKLAGILVSKIRNIKEYNPSANSGAGDIVIPIDDVYYAFFKHKVLDTGRFSKPEAQETERAVYDKFVCSQQSVLSRIRSELTTDAPTAYRALPKDMQSYMSYIVNTFLTDNQILISKAVDTKDPTYIAWKSDETIGLKEYLEYAISKEWIDISNISVEDKYLDSSQIYDALVDYIVTSLESEEGFSSLIYKYMIRDNSLSGKEVCMLLYEQGILPADDEDKAAVESGQMSAYQFMMKKITNLQITPGQLGLDPCSGSAVITDVNTGQVLASVSYPGYDNNRLANSMDSAYFQKLQSDKEAAPMYNRATQERTAPGSTFKMLSAVAGLSEQVISTTATIQDLGVYDKITPSPKCWLYVRSHGTHGAETVSTALRDSCNYFFYEVGYRLGTANGNYKSEYGLERLKKYAEMFGLTSKSGIEIPESEPQFSEEDAVRSAIGQGSHAYTTSELNRYVMTVANSGNCYELTLLDKVTSPSGETIKSFGTKEGTKVDLPDTIWNAVHEGMRMVVEKTSAFDGLGVQAAGKTGTAQQTTSRPDHALFVGYAPYEQPEIAIATRIANGYTSANTAEITRDIVKYYFNLASAEEIISGTATETQTVTGD